MDGNGQQNPTQIAPSNEIRLVIRFDQVTGAINVEGPINNGILVYGMLELARQAVERHLISLTQNNRILPVGAMPVLRQ